MWGFSWKRFFVTLGLSVGIWMVSMMVQGITGFSDYFNVFGKCSLTGYPIPLCIQSNNQFKMALISLLNITIWFWIIHLFWGWFEKRQE